MSCCPNVADIAEIARRCVDAGASALCVVNTLQAMSIDVKRRRPRIARVFAGLSGPAMKPVALRMVEPSGWAATVKATYVHQRARYQDSSRALVDGSERFVVTDLSLAYQLRSHATTLSLDARNLFDRRFRYQEIDVYSSPRVSSRRLALLRLSTSF